MRQVTKILVSSIIAALIVYAGYMTIDIATNLVSKRHGDTTVAVVPSADGHDRRLHDIANRNDTLDRATKLYPMPKTENFPMRAALVKYTQRQDLKNHTYYVYFKNECFQCPGGISYQYAVAQTYPQSTCNFLSSTDDVDTQYTGDPVLTAPSLDGIFYGGAGASAACAWFYFSSDTDALQVFSQNEKWWVSDKFMPSLNATPVTVQ